MQAAILILAHDQPDHLARLVKHLQCDWARIFIHIDKKADGAAFKRLIPAQKNTVILEDPHRVAVTWGGFSVVRATLSLLRQSLACGEQFDRFCLLSGSDFPVKPLDFIRSALASDTEYIRIDRRLGPSDANSHTGNVRRYHFMDSGFLGKLSRLQKIPRKPYRKITLYQGSQWWSLTAGCVRHIMEFLKQNKDYSAFHRHVRCSDEVFFHSIVKASPFAARVSHDFEKARDPDSYRALNEHGSHYIDWNAPGVPLPKILDDTDTARILNSSALFARKFRNNISSTLLQTIENATEHKS